MSQPSLFARCINLDTRPDRWAAVQHLGIQRHSATKITDTEALGYLCLRTQAEYVAGRRVAEGIPNRGAVGCSLSHIAVWREFLDTTSDLCLVLEDDVNCSKQELESCVDYFLARLGTWDIALLGWTTPLKRSLLWHPTKHEIVPWPRGQSFYGSHAYIVTRPTAERLLKEALPIQMQIDFYLQAQAWRWRMRLVPSPKRIPQRQDLGSDISMICLNCDPATEKIMYAVAIAALLLLIALK